MRWPDSAVPVRMRRVAMVAPEDALRDVLVCVAAAAALEVDRGDREQVTPGDAARLLQHAGQPPRRPVLSVARPDLGRLEQAGRYDLVAGEAQLEAYASAAVRRSGAAALAGWIPAGRLPEVAAALARAGGALVPLPRPPGADAPTLLAGGGMHRALTPLVQTYGTVPYADLDPTWLTWASYVLMFGMMFGDAGARPAAGRGGRGGARWLAAMGPPVPGGLAVCRRRRDRGHRLRPALRGMVWPDRPGAHDLAQPARPPGHPARGGWGHRRGPARRSVRARRGQPVAGGRLVGRAVRALGHGGQRRLCRCRRGGRGWYAHRGALLAAGGLVALAGLALALVGFLADAGGGGTGIVQASVELVDLVVRLGSNVVSFTRLAAFGLTHAALGLIVWEGTRALWARGGALAAAGVAVFVAGTVLAFSLEALVAAIQALRLEYYELFSRVFVTQGRPFRPWHVPTAPDAEDSAAHGVPGLSMEGAGR